MLKNKPTILFIDDIKEMHSTVEAAFDGIYNIISALTCQEAQTILKNKNHKIDLILLDYIVPGKISSTSFLSTITVKYPELPVIMFSSQKDGKTVRECYNLGCVDFITKPFSIDETIKIINKVLKINDLPKNIDSRFRYNEKDVLLITKAQHFIEFAIVNNFDIDGEKAAKTLKISYKWLNKLFMKLLGCNIKHCIDDCRIKHIIRSIEECKPTIVETALSVGIKDRKAFNRLFHKYTGMTIQQYWEKACSKKARFPTV